jgi:protein TonB
LVLLIWRPAVFVTPQLVAHGEGGNATPVVTPLYLPQHMGKSAPVETSKVSIPAPVPQAAKQHRSNVLENDRTDDAAEAGSREGSSFAGASEGDQIFPAIPIPATFVDPTVSRWELPAGLEGDVIVEITIDEQGIVVAVKLVQGIGHGIDEKVIAALRDRRYRPATRNGVPILSKQDVLRHFPS